MLRTATITVCRCRLGRQRRNMTTTPPTLLANVCERVLNIKKNDAVLGYPLPPRFISRQEEILFNDVNLFLRIMKDRSSLTLYQNQHCIKMLRLIRDSGEEMVESGCRLTENTKHLYADDMAKWVGSSELYLEEFSFWHYLKIVNNDDFTAKKKLRACVAEIIHSEAVKQNNKLYRAFVPIMALKRTDVTEFETGRWLNREQLLLEIYQRQDYVGKISKILTLPSILNCK